MRIETEIKKWGNSLALRVSGVMAELPQFKPGTRVTVDVNHDGFIVRRAAEKPSTYRFPYSERALLTGITPEKAHAEVVAISTGSEVGF